MVTSLGSYKGDNNPSNIESNPHLLGSTSDRLASFFKRCGSYLITPFWQAQAYFQYCLLPTYSGQYGQEVYKVHEYSKRLFIGSCAFSIMCLTIPFVLANCFLTRLAQAIESQDYSYTSGHAEEIHKNQPKLFHLNCCGFAGGLPYNDGLVPVNQRYSKLLKEINRIDGDIIFLSETNRIISESFCQDLKEKYAHIWYNIGFPKWGFGLENSLLIASRLPLLSPPEYIPFVLSPTGVQRFLKRGFFVLYTKNQCYIYTHLHPGKTDQDKQMRAHQFNQINEFIGDKAIFLIGDLNIDALEKPNDEYQSLIGRGYKDCSDSSCEELTATEDLKEKIKGTQKKGVDEALDFIFVKNQGKDFVAPQVKLINMIASALSDHNGLIAE